MYTFTHLSPVVWVGVQTNCHFAAVGQRHLRILQWVNCDFIFFFLHVTVINFLPEA